MSTINIDTIKSNLEISDDDSANKILKKLAEIKLNEGENCISSCEKVVAQKLSHLSAKDDFQVFRILAQLVDNDIKSSSVKQLVVQLSQFKINYTKSFNSIFAILAQLHVKDKCNVDSIIKKIKTLQFSILESSNTDINLEHFEALKKFDDPLDKKAEKLQKFVKEMKTPVNAILTKLLTDLKILSENVARIVQGTKTIVSQSFTAVNVKQDFPKRLEDVLNESNTKVETISKQLTSLIAEETNANYSNSVEKVFKSLVNMTLKKLNDIISDIRQQFKEMTIEDANKLEDYVDLLKAEVRKIKLSYNDLRSIPSNVDNIMDNIFDQLSQLDRNEDLFVAKILEQLISNRYINDEEVAFTTFSIDDVTSEIFSNKDKAFQVLNHFSLCFRLGCGYYGSMNIGDDGHHYKLVRKYLVYLAQRKDLVALRQSLAESLRHLPEFDRRHSGPGGQGPNKTHLNKCLIGTRDSIMLYVGILKAHEATNTEGNKFT